MKGPPMLDWLQNLTETAAPALQWLVIMFAGAIPFIESYFGSSLGVIAGTAAPVAIGAAVVGNWLSMFLLVTFGAKLHANRKPKESSTRQQKFRRLFDRYGVAGVSLLGQAVLPSQLTSMGMVALGSPRGTVIAWQSVSILVWGLAFGLLAVGGVSLLG